MSLEKSYCLQTAAGLIPYPWGNSTSDKITFGSDPTTLTKVNEISAIYKFQFQNITVGATVNITIPAAAFFTQFNTTVTYFTPEGLHTESFSSTSGRGDVAFMQQLMDYSGYKFIDNSAPEILNTPPTPITLTNWEMRVPFKIIHDFAEIEDKYLAIKEMGITVTWVPLLQAFQPPITSPNFNVQLTGIDYIYSSYQVKDLSIIRDHNFLSPPKTHIYTFQDFVPAGSGVYSKTLSPPGIPLKVYFYLLNKTANSPDGLTQGIYNLNPNDSSIINNITITAGNKSFPVIQGYNSQKTAVSQLNVIRHFDDLQKISDTWANNRDNILTFSSWLNTFRIYGVGLSGVTESNNLNVKLQFAEPPTVSCYITFAVIYNKL